MAKEHKVVPRGKETGFLTKTAFFIMIGLLAAWGGHLRFFALETQGFWIDEGFSVATAMAILKEGYPLLPSGAVSWAGAGAHYPMALGLELFDGIHFGARFFSAASGTLLLAVFYVMNVRLTRSRFQALTATLLLALMSYEIAWSRQARYYIYLQLYSVASLASLYGWIEKGRRDRLAFSFLLAGAAALTHRAGLVTLLVIALTAPFRKKEKGGGGKKLSTPILVGSALAALLLVGAAVLSWPGFADAVRSLRRTSGENYLYDYGGFLAFQFGYSLLWLPVGILAALWKRSRLALPLLLAVAAYIYVIGLRTTLFHYRYLLPVLPFVISFIALGFTAFMRRLQAIPGLIAAAAAIALPALFFMSAFSGQFQIFPKDGYVLGYTAPQPEWREAYRWIKARSGGKKPDTLSTFPMWHDIYLGEKGGDKYFLPFSLSGHEKHVREAPRYSRATVVEGPDALKDIEGFAVFDDFSFAMIENDAVRQRLEEKEPAAYFKSPEGFELYVWRLPIK